MNFRARSRLIKAAVIVCIMLLVWGVWLVWFQGGAGEGDTGQSTRRRTVLMPQPPPAGDPSTRQNSRSPSSNPAPADDPFLLQKTAWKTARAVATAIDEFHRDYDRLPEPASAVKDTDCISDTDAAEGLISTLLGRDEIGNPNKIDYLGALAKAKTDSAGLSKGGLVLEEESAALYDPWGNLYHVTLDLNLNEKIDNPNEDEVNQGTPELRKTILVWSAGPDGSFDTWEDNLTSWKSPGFLEQSKDGQ